MSNLEEESHDLISHCVLHLECSAYLETIQKENRKLINEADSCNGESEALHIHHCYQYNDDTYVMSI